MKFRKDLRDNPPAGMRFVKTVLATFLAALAMKYVVHDTPFFACIGALIAIDRDIYSSFRNVLMRNIGTVIGGIMGMILLLLRVILILQ